MKTKIKALEESRDSYVKLLAKASETLAPVYEEEIKKLVAKISEAHDAWAVNLKEESKEVLTYSNFDIKAIQVDVANVPEFTGKNIEECDKFLSKLDQLHKLLVEDVDAQLEKRFLNCCIRRLSQSVWKHMTTSNVNVSTYENLKNYIKKNYAGQLNAYQTFSKVFDIPFHKDEKFHVFASKLENELQTAHAAVKEHFRPVNGSNPLSSEQLMGFFGGMIFSEELKKNFFEIFKDLTTDFDNMSTCTQIAQRAEYFRERLSGSAFNSATFLNRGDSNDKKKLNEFSDKKKSNEFTDKKRTSKNPSWYHGDRFDPDFQKKKELWKNYLEEQNGEKNREKKHENTGNSENKNETPKTFHSVLGPESHFQ
jgi:hypothetical protein